MRELGLLILCCVGAAAESSTIEGRVVNAVSGDPVAKASVLLMPGEHDWEHSYSATSDAAGKFTIANIQPGKYRLRATRASFVPRDHRALLDLGAPQELKDIELRLTPHGVVTGRVFDADGEPLEGADVQLLQSKYVNGRKTLSTTRVASTNDLGEFRWAGLVPGKYYVYAEGHGDSTPLSPAKKDYVPVYYPGATDSSGASAIEVAPGAQVRADIALRKAATVAVKGRVVVEVSGAGPPAARLSRRAAHDDSATGTYRIRPGIVNASGEFEVRGVVPGHYTAMAEVSKSGRSYAGWTAVDVAETNIEGVVIVIRDDVVLTGKVRLEDDAKADLSNARVQVQHGGPQIGSTLLRRTYPVAEDRTFRVADLGHERYGLAIGGLPDGFYARNILSGNVDVTFTGVDLTPGAAPPVEIVLSPKAGVVSGAAEAGATVVLVPNEKERAALAAFYRQAAADQFGRFTFRNVAPGDYTVFAWEEVEPTAWMDPEFLKPIQEKGSPVTVAESSEASLQVTVIRAPSK